MVSRGSSAFKAFIQAPGWKSKAIQGKVFSWWLQRYKITNRSTWDFLSLSLGTDPWSLPPLPLVKTRHLARFWVKGVKVLSIYDEAMVRVWMPGRITYWCQYSVHHKFNDLKFLEATVFCMLFLLTLIHVHYFPMCFVMGIGIHI